MVPFYVIGIYTHIILKTNMYGTLCVSDTKCFSYIYLILTILWEVGHIVSNILQMRKREA